MHPSQYARILVLRKDGLHEPNDEEVSEDGSGENPAPHIPALLRAPDKVLACARFALT